MNQKCLVLFQYVLVSNDKQMSKYDDRWKNSYVLKQNKNMVDQNEHEIKPSKNCQSSSQNAAQPFNISTAYLATFLCISRTAQTLYGFLKIQMCALAYSRHSASQI